MLNATLEMQHDKGVSLNVAEEAIVHVGAGALENREHFQSPLDHIGSVGSETAWHYWKSGKKGSLYLPEMNSSSRAPSVDAVQTTRCAIIRI